MAAGMWHEPGTTYGPCAGECQHIDCAATRRAAESPCSLCHDPVGYGRRFYIDPDGGTPQDGPYVHAGCLEERLDDDRRAAQRQRTSPEGRS